MRSQPSCTHDLGCHRELDTHPHTRPRACTGSCSRAQSPCATTGSCYKARNRLTCASCVRVRWLRQVKCPIFSLKWTPEGRRLITGASTGEFTLWNGLTFNFETILQAHQSGVRDMVWSHNANWMVTCDDDGKIMYVMMLPALASFVSSQLCASGTTSTVCKQRLGLRMAQSAAPARCTCACGTPAATPCRVLHDSPSDSIGVTFDMLFYADPLCSTLFLLLSSMHGAPGTGNPT